MTGEREDRRQEELTPELIDRFLDDLQRRGRSAGSLRSYRQALMGLYDYLPEGEKQLNAETGPKWKAWLESKGFSVRTVNARVSALNSMYQFIGRKEWTQTDFAYATNAIQPELTRAEYLRLLQAAKMGAKEKAYLLIKTIGGAGLRIQELSQLTVDAVRRGTVDLEYHNRTQKRVMHIPQSLQEELLDYAQRENIDSGPVFLTPNGVPMSRSSVHHCVNRVSRDAQVAEEKANPRCLWKMYQSVHESIRANIDVLAEQAYIRMLDEEQLMVGWRT